MSTPALAVAQLALALSSAAVIADAALDVSGFGNVPVDRVPLHAELGAAALTAAKANPPGLSKVVSVLAPADRVALVRLLPYLPQLLATPVVFHIALPAGAGHADVLALRSSGLGLIYSSTTQQAYDHALVASAAAAASQTAFIHFYEMDSPSVQLEEVTPHDLPAVLATSSPSASAANGHANGKANGHGNGHINGHVHGNDAPASPVPAKGLDLTTALQSAFAHISDLVGHTVEPYTYKAGNERLVVSLGPSIASIAGGASTLELHLVRPNLLASQVEDVLRKAGLVAVLEKTPGRTTRFGPVFTDTVAALHNVHGTKADLPQVLSGSLGDLDSSSASDLASALEQRAKSFTLGTQAKKAHSTPIVTTPTKHEQAYQLILEQIFGSRLSVVNSPTSEADPHPSARSPEYAFGQVLAQLERRDGAIKAAQAALRSQSLSANVQELATKLVQGDAASSAAAAQELLSTLSQETNLSPELKALLATLPSVEDKSRWIVGSDAWAYDAGMGGVHNVISSGKPVNMLVFDTLPYTERDAVVPEKRKKDIGLYAMSYGGVYVASTAIYSDYTQVLHALREADAFDGPSIVLAYVPFRTQDAPALEVLKETKLAVDSGYWPLFRWDPSAEAKSREVFHLDSARLREQLKQFLDRNNQLSYLAKAQPQLAYDLVASQGAGLRAAQKHKAKQAYDDLLSSLDGPPLLILFASDGGTAEKLAKKLGQRAQARGVATRVLAMDDFPTSDELAQEENVLFITSTAGQGEFPQNGRDTWKTLGKLAPGSLSAVKTGVFGLGDSHYWPRPEDAGYYNKPSKDLAARLEALGAEPLIALGLGDDQDADGWQTGYKAWEPLVWKALGVDHIQVTEPEPEPITNENIKIASNYLRGTILEGLADKSTGAIAESDTQLTKFHGTYMQFDRDTVEDRKAAGLEPAYSFMIRCRIPGGVATPAQWLALDQVADDYGNRTLKITTRQTIQYHYVVKSNLKSAMQAINKTLLDTIAACGDVNRNVMASPLPSLSELHEDVFDFSKRLSDHLLPRLNAYHEIWLDKGTDSKSQLLVGGALQDYEPLYGPYYLPRKFKIAIAVPPRNDVDCFAHDVGLIAIADPTTKRLLGFNLSVGGGMGVTHSMKATYPRTGSVIGFITPEQTLDAVRTVMLTQRDTGDRANRKQARLKYTIDKHFGGADKFRDELERRLGWKFAPARPYKFDCNTDQYGWIKDHRGGWHCGLWLENGRVKDTPESPFRTGLRELAKWHKGTFRMTPNQHIIVSDVSEEDKPKVEEHLRKYKMDNWNLSGIQRSASACVAFPTCGLAMAESERYLPILVEKVEKLFLAAGLRDDEVVMRMSGCANGCSRPWLGEIGFVGKAPGSYLMLLGGGHAGQRLSKIFRDGVGEEQILNELKPLINRYAQERLVGEPFGDWVIRAGVIAPTTSGAEFYDNVNTDGYSLVPPPAVIPGTFA